jgi:hypothetical protein
MKVRCVSRSAKGLPRGIPLERIWGSSSNEGGRSFPLVVGKEYVVYGVTITLGHVWYYVCDENFVYYPVWNPAALFEVSDPSIPRDWCIEYRRWQGEQDEIFLQSFPEWVHDKFFYDKLTDREPNEVAIFNGYRKLYEGDDSAQQPKLR